MEQVKRQKKLKESESLCWKRFHGEITETLTEAKNDLEHEIVEVVADKGY